MSINISQNYNNVNNHKKIRYMAKKMKKLTNATILTTFSYHTDEQLYRWNTREEKASYTMNIYRKTKCNHL